MAATKSPRWTHNESAKGKNHSPEYRAWHLMKQRVRQKKQGYTHVTYDPRWERFENFLADMGRKPTPQHSLDRRDGTKGYTKSNCRWATKTEQSRNTKFAHNLTAFGETLCISAWAEKLGCSAPCIYWRITHGWTVADAVSVPSQRKQ